MKLLDLVPKKETLEALQGVEARLLRRRQSSFIGLLLAVIGATVQTVSILASNTSLLDTLNKLLNALLTHPRSIPEMLFSREALGILFLLLGLGIYFTLRRTGLFMKEANEPFRYTFSIDKFKTIEGTSTADGFCLNDLGRLNLLQYDVRERLDTRIKRFSLLPTAGKEGGAQRYRSHIHITADVAVREDKGKWVIHVMPQVRIGPEGSAATLAAPVKYPVCVAVQGLRSHQLSAQEYDQLVERVYSSISTEIYRQLESDVKEKIRLFPSDYMRAVALCVEAEDFSRSNTVDAYDRAVGIFEDALRYFAVAEVRPASRLLLRISLLWRAEVRFQHRHARARVGYARCLVYRRILSSFSGRVRNPIFRARVELQRAIEALNDLEPWFTGKSPDSRLRSFLNFLSFPTDSWVRQLLCRPGDHLWQAQRVLRFDACTINALCHQALGAIRLARESLDLARSVDPPLSSISSRYLLAAAEIEGDLGQKILLLRRSVELTPEGQIPQYLLAYYSEMRFRRSEELSLTRARPVLEEYNDVLRINPGNIAAIAAQGHLYWLCGVADQAERKFNEGLELKSVSAETFVGEMYYGLARIAAEKGALGDSLRYFSEAIEADPGVATNLAESARGTGSYFESIGSSMLNRYRTFLHTVRDVVRKSEKRLQHGKEVSAPDPAAKAVLSYTLNDHGNACWNSFFRRGDRDALQAAAASYREAIEIYPANVIAHYGLWSACDWLGQYDEALRALDKVVRHLAYWQPAVITHIWYTLYGLRRTMERLTRTVQDLEKQVQEHERTLRDIEHAQRADQVAHPTKKTSTPAPPTSQSGTLVAARSRLEHARESLEQHRATVENARRDLEERPLQSLRLGLQNTKLAPLLERQDLDLDGGGIQPLFARDIAWERLGEEEAQALRAWANALLWRRESGRAWRCALQICSVLAESFYRDHFDVCEIQTALVDAYDEVQSDPSGERRRRFLDGVSSMPLDLPTRDALRAVRRGARAAILDTIEYWVTSDPWHFAALRWVHDRCLTGSDAERKKGRDLLDLPLKLGPHGPLGYEVIGNLWLWLADTQYDPTKLGACRRKKLLSTQNTYSTGDTVAV